MTNTVKDPFNRQFPYLKLEFLRHRHESCDSTTAKDFIYGNEQLAVISNTLKEGELNIKPSGTVAQLEEDFLENFGLYVCIFRKQKDGWIDTQNTRAYSLEKQDQLGREACGLLLPNS